ncbi:hypothetical protein JXA32_00350 [Candidatus Sumerlaeota bacterium]|nr:hypothetical protein [Candidatus Sumerlaeota bacterium]
MTETLWGVLIGGLIGAITGIATTLISHVLQERKEFQFRKHDSKLRFMERQLNDLYAPMLGLCKQIRSLSESRFIFDQSGEKWWNEFAVPTIHSRTPDARQKDTEAIEKAIDYDNKQLKETLLPKYRKMAQIFSEYYALAEAEMKKHYNNFIFYVDVWDRALSEDYPQQYLYKIKHKEEILFPLYDHLEEHVARITIALSTYKK